MARDMANTTLFEVSWEVCNKVGGIYAVVSSKVLQAMDTFGEHYYLLGPDLGKNPGFEETREEEWAPVIHAVETRNLRCRFGRWNIPGRPRVILVNFKDRFNQNQLLYELWNRFGVDSLTGGWDYVEPVMFSTACGEVIAAINQAVVEPEGGQSVAHFHEWMCGAGLLNLRHTSPKVATVFTTHATMLGRAMAGSGVDIYRQMDQISPQREAAAHNITAKCSMERVSAREADCFTTVSQITGSEATVFLGRNPDVLTFNGLDLRVIPDYSEDRAPAQANRKKLLAAASKLLRREMPENTRIMAISGRYEFHNKGVDVFLDAMAGVNESLRGSETQVLALCVVMGGHSGVNPEAVSGEPGRMPKRSGGWISSHNVYNQPQDPIINACLRLGLDNQPDNPVQVVFVPALLDGADGFLNMTYEEVLSSCDLGVFPSWYEPWGYTPQESAAWSVPTVTSDLSGFGLWVREHMGGERADNGVTIIQRRQKSYEDTVASLKDCLLEAATQPEEKLAEQRKAVRRMTEGCSWEQFFPYYLEAYSQALEKAESRRGSVFAHDFMEDISPRVVAGASSETPVLHSFNAVAPLMAPLRRLRELSRNLWWCWHPGARQLFQDICPTSWIEHRHNPVRVLAQASAERLSMLAKDKAFLERLRLVLEDFDAYMSAPPREDLGEFLTPQHPLAYFSTEYGIHESMPIYSGGLGVLSGDHLKSASDLNSPLVGVGLLYKNGYFRQKVDGSGRQVAVYPENDFTMLPVERLLDGKGEPLLIALDMPGRKMFAQAWLVRVGRVRLYLLDTDVQQNTLQDRQTTARLYEADRDCRIRQEMLLGIGGVQLLKLLDIRPCAYHMNEGHSAFLILERIRIIMRDRGLSFAEAGELVRGSCLFTTHTPVDAGNERFSLDLMEKYFSSYSQALGLSWPEFLHMGRLEGHERNVFEMTVLALNYSCKANGVSRLHGEVSRHMWHPGWKGVPVTEVPIGHVTNGVHVASYVGKAMRPLLNEALGSDWLKIPAGDPAWNGIDNISESALWDARRMQKTSLLESIRKHLPAMCAKLGVPRSLQKEMATRLNASSLVIGFARRFAPYKRANLIFADPERLQRILSNPECPVVLVFAGKAHPADNAGIDIMQEVVRYTCDPRFAGRIFFLEDYNLDISRLMVRGCDVWLNTPRRPHEASGTSGMKLSVNGGVNLSIADGWWCEGYDKQNGWTIGPAVTRLSDGTQSDYADAEALYALLEDSVIPLYYDRDADGLPHQWLAMVKRAMKTLTAQFSSDRMVSDYVRGYYIPVAERFASLVKDNFALAKRLAAWKHALGSRFSTAHITQVIIEGAGRDTVVCGQPIQVTVTVAPGSMDADDLLLQFVAGPGAKGDFIDRPSVRDLSLVRRLDDGRLVYAGEFAAMESGEYVYGIRMLAATEGMWSPLETRFVQWA